jgi:hypothetical protein
MAERGESDPRRLVDDALAHLAASRQDDTPPCGAHAARQHRDVRTAACTIVGSGFYQRWRPMMASNRNTPCPTMSSPWRRAARAVNRRPTILPTAMLWGSVGHFGLDYTGESKWRSTK